MQQVMTKQPRIVLLCSNGDSSRSICAALRRRFGEITVIREESGSRWQYLKRRVRRLGLLTVAGQVLFAALFVPVLKRLSRNRIAELRERYGLANEPIDGDSVIVVPSVNSEQARQALADAAPDVVVINGTRIIGEKTLAAVDVPFVNAHHGITPLYRGIHGGYWALADRKPELVGTTIHYVDRGIDTGNIIRQVHFDVSPRDNYATYPYLHTGEVLPELIHAVEQILGDERPAEPAPPELPSQLRTHPTIWGYVGRRLFQGVR